MNFRVFTLAFLIVSTRALAQSSPVFQTEKGAIRGYDPVAYFKQGDAVEGKKEHSLHWNGATWYFSSKENKDLFEKNPEAFAPQYGGYCAYGTADNHKAPTQPDAWSIVDNKLYLNYNKKVQTEWKKHQEGYIEQADKNWPLLKDAE